MVRIIPNRLRSHNHSQPGSRSASPMRGTPSTLVLRTNVIKGRNLCAKDKTGTSDPFLVLSLGDTRQSTPTIQKTLDPEWQTKFDLPITGPHCLLLEGLCWDKDRWGKDYMGEFDVLVEDLFQGDNVTPPPQWFSLKSRRKGSKKSSPVSGEVQIQFSIVDTANPNATPVDLLHKFTALTMATTGGAIESVADGSNGSTLTHSSSLDSTVDDLDSTDDETADESEEPISGEVAPEIIEKRKRRLRLRNLRKKTKAKAYEFGSGHDVVGIAFIEVSRISNLPPERNVTRTSFDMDPFVVTSLGRKTYRTKVMRHDLNPVYNERMVFQVLRHEQQYSLNFSVVDRDKLSGNDFVGTTSFPLADIITSAPDADSETGLFPFRDSVDPVALPDKPKSRFRIPLSRTNSGTNLKTMSRPPMSTKPTQTSLKRSESSNEEPKPLAVPISGRPSPEEKSKDPFDGTQEPAQQDPDLRTYVLPLDLKRKEKWNDREPTELYIKAKYLPYAALRQQFWRAMIRQYTNEVSTLSHVELSTMLDTLGSTLRDSTINGFFTRFGEENAKNGLSPNEITVDQAVICLEDQLRALSQRASPMDKLNKKLDQLNTLKDNIVHPEVKIDSGDDTSNKALKPPSRVPTQDVDPLGAAGETGQNIKEDDLNGGSEEEHIIEIRECPICHQPRLHKRSDSDIITHIATCASLDWRSVNNIVMAGFVTASQAQRKWYSKVVTKISYGGYKLGANSANILVQDRMTGQINEERMSVYVRLGIRLLYKGLGSRDMETKRIRKLLKNLSIKQGRKYDDPASAREINGFISFHQLDMSEVLHPTSSFKNFNQFFYRQLKPDARPCSAPQNPKIIVSPSDCRAVVFNKISDATRIWVKGREFSIKRLIGNTYPDDVPRYEHGALGIFRLAPQDYHRFHIPVDGTLCEPKTIEGEYYTVNPMAIRSALDVYGENVRVVVPIDSVAHGRVMVICVGAMMVGSTVITRKAGEQVKRAEELGYFAFGGSTLLVLFEEGKMEFDSDLIDNASGALETLIRVGMSVGHSPDEKQFTPDMRKKDENITVQDKQEAKRRIEGSLAPTRD